MVEKMTDEEVESAGRRFVNGECDNEDAGRLLNHIAALTAERDEARAELVELRRRTWTQCSTEGNPCLGGCRSMKEHDSYTHRMLISELETLHPVVVLHEDMTRLKREAEAERDALRKRFDDWCDALADALPGGIRVSTPEEALAVVRERVKALEAELSRLQVLPEMEWASVTATLTQRFAKFARTNQPVAKAMMEALDAGKVYVDRLRARAEQAEQEREAARRIEVELRKSLGFTEAAVQAANVRCQEAENWRSGARKRAGDMTALKEQFDWHDTVEAGIAAVTHYVLGGAPSAVGAERRTVSEMGGLEGGWGESRSEEAAPAQPDASGEACALASEAPAAPASECPQQVKCDPETPGVFECGRHCSCRCHTPAEPTTAEAFATVRERLEHGLDQSSVPAELFWRGALSDLSLLERRMWAMERVVDEARTLRSRRENGLLAGPDTPALNDVWTRLDAALSAITALREKKP